MSKLLHPDRDKAKSKSVTSKMAGTWRDSSAAWLGAGHRPFSPRCLLPLSQLRVFGFGLLEDRDVRVGVLPQREEILISRAGLGRVARERVTFGREARYRWNLRMRAPRR